MFAFPRGSVLLGILCFAPSMMLASALSVNGTCEVGNCTSVDVLQPGTSTSGFFDFTYTFGNTDAYHVFGDFSASDPSTGTGSTTIKIDLTAVYLGNSTHTVSSADVLTTDMFQKYNYPGSLDGTYSEHTNAFFGGKIASSSTLDAQLFYDGQSLGLLGPFSPPGPGSQTKSANLTGLTNPLSADYRFDFDFGAGSQVGSNMSTLKALNVPEPGEALLMGVGLFGFALSAAIRRRRKSS